MRFGATTSHRATPTSKATSGPLRRFSGVGKPSIATSPENALQRQLAKPARPHPWVNLGIVGHCTLPKTSPIGAAPLTKPYLFAGGPCRVLAVAMLSFVRFRTAGVSGKNVPHIGGIFRRCWHCVPPPAAPWALFSGRSIRGHQRHRKRLTAPAKCPLPFCPDGFP